LDSLINILDRTINKPDLTFKYYIHLRRNENLTSHFSVTTCSKFSIMPLRPYQKIESFSSDKQNADSDRLLGRSGHEYIDLAYIKCMWEILRVVEKKIVWLEAGHRREIRRLCLRRGRRTRESEKDIERNREEVVVMREGLRGIWFVSCFR
jgi:hypothetical protein